MSRSALLLRAVNVSGRNRVPMAELRALLAERTELEDIATYIASGNIVCATPPDVTAARTTVRALIAERFDVDTPVIARSHREIERMLQRNPYVHSDIAEKLLHVMVLEGTPKRGALDLLRERLVPGEEVELVGDDLWIHYSADGVHATKLTKSVLDRALGVSGTARNVRTMTRLAELTA